MSVCLAGAETRGNLWETVCGRGQHVHRAFLELTSGATLHQIEREEVSWWIKEGSHVIPLSLSPFCPPFLFHLLFPMSMMTILELECCLASSSHVVRCSNVSRLKMETGHKYITLYHRPLGDYKQESSSP